MTLQGACVALPPPCDSDSVSIDFCSPAPISTTVHDTDEISYSDFINRELIPFSMADNVHSIPSVADGLKPVQRKVIWACFKRKLKKEIKVQCPFMIPCSSTILILSSSHRSRNSSDTSLSTRHIITANRV